MYTICILMCATSIQGVQQPEQTQQRQNEPHVAYNNNNYVYLQLNLYQVLSQMLSPLSGAYDRTKGFCSSILSQIDDAYRWMQQHPFYTAIGAAGAIYVSLNWYAWRLASYLNDDTCWGRWKYHLTNEELQHIPFQTLGNNLIEEIQRRYIDTTSPTDFDQPMIKFARDLSDEYHMLHRYAYVCKILTWTGLRRISWYDAHLYDTIDMRIQRIHIIWNIFVSWMADYHIINGTMTQSQHMTSQTGV